MSIQHIKQMKQNALKDLDSDIRDLKSEVEDFVLRYGSAIDKTIQEVLGDKYPKYRSPRIFHDNFPTFKVVTRDDTLLFPGKKYLQFRWYDPYDGDDDFNYDSYLVDLDKFNELLPNNLARYGCDSNKSFNFSLGGE